MQYNFQTVYGDFRLAALEYLQRQTYWHDIVGTINPVKAELEFLAQFPTD